VSTATRIDLPIENHKNDKKVILATITSSHRPSVNVLLNSGGTSSAVPRQEGKT